MVMVVHSFLQGHEMEQMRSETVTKLSNIIRDKDIEIEALKSKNESLLLLASDSEQKAENNQIATLEKEKQDLYEALAQKHQESLTYYNEIQRLVKVCCFQALSSSFIHLILDCS